MAAVAVAIDIFIVFDSVLPPYPQLFFRVSPCPRAQDHLELAQVQSRARGALWKVYLGRVETGFD